MNQNCLVDMKPLYKGKRADGKGWVEGSYIYDQRDDLDIICYIWENGQRDYQIEKGTICQWTGLHDKNGVKIWEGDILETPTTHHSVGSVYTRGVWKGSPKTWIKRDSMGLALCEWVGYGFNFTLQDKSHHGISLPNMKVRGNKWDNPELLKQ